MIFKYNAKESSPGMALAADRSNTPNRQPMSGFRGPHSVPWHGFGFRWSNRLPHMGNDHGFSIVDLTMVLVMIAAYFLVAYPAMVPSRAKASRINCVNNLKQVGLALRIYSNDHGERFPWQISTNDGGSMELLSSGMVVPHFRAVSNELSNPRILQCPTDKTKTRAIDFGRTFSDANISYFLGLSADETKPSTILSGDRDITLTNRQLYGTASLSTNSPVGWSKEMHGRAGNILFSDGSVSQSAESTLRKAFSEHTAAPIRLLIP